VGPKLDGRRSPETAERPLGWNSVHYKDEQQQPPIHEQPWVEKGFAIEAGRVPGDEHSSRRNL